MRKIFQKCITFSAATVLSLGILSIPALKDAFHINTSITVSADTIGSGLVGSKFCKNTNTNVWLYFSVTDETQKTASVSGCSTGTDNVSVTIPETVSWNGKTYTVTSIADNAFKNQTNICSLYGGKKLISIGNYAFYQCTNLTYDSFGKDKSGKAHLDSIGDYAFYNCTSLSSTCLTDTRIIGAYAFNGCSSLSSIYLYDTEYIGSHAFSNCSNANCINLSESNICTIPNYCFYNCSNAQYIDLPRCIYTIGSYSFSYCKNINKIYFPSGTTKIDQYAFYRDSKLKTVMMPTSVTSVGTHAFNLCTSLKYFVCKNPVTTFGDFSIGYNYQCKNSNFVIWGNGGNIQTYAISNEFTYHDTSEAASLSKENFKDYMWKVGNTSISWAASNGNYLILDQHKPYDLAHGATSKWEGSCYGMAAVSVLVRNGELKVEDFTENVYHKIASIPSSGLSNFAKSFVNTCWSAGQNSSYDYSLPYDGLFSNNEMLTYIEYITYGADAAIFCYHSPETNPVGHAIVCFGLEYLDDAPDKTSSYWIINGKQMNARILLYDGNYYSFNPARCIYVNTKTGEWTNGNHTFYSYYDGTGVLQSTYKNTANCNCYIRLHHSTQNMFNGVDFKNFLK